AGRRWVYGSLFRNLPWWLTSEVLNMSPEFVFLQSPGGCGWRWIPAEFRTEAKDAPGLRTAGRR
ncbi:MAG: hypothetical protein ACK6EB_08970, partial [Planctomyces sp.]